MTKDIDRKKKKSYPPAPPVPDFGDHWERMKDPWHRDAFPETHKKIAPRQCKKRKEGWALIDWCGNVISFVLDEHLKTPPLKEK
jgi:hypothetical protein